MTPTAVFIAAVILLPAVGLVAWAWFAMAQVHRELDGLSGFEGRHFVIGPEAAEGAEGTGSPIPG